MFQGSFRDVFLRVFHDFRGCVQNVSRKFHENLQGVSKKFHVAWHSLQLPEEKEGMLIASVGSCLSNAEDQSRYVAITADLSGLLSRSCKILSRKHTIMCSEPIPS